MTKPLIELRHCDVLLQQQTILHDVSWQLQSGENWAFWGGNGAGKSTLLQLIRGAIWPHFARGSRTYCFDNIVTTSPLRAREQIAFACGAQHQKYRRQEWEICGREVLLSGFFGSELLHQKPSNAQIERMEMLSRELKIDALLSRDINALSHGELRRLLIARALVTQPKVLLLDEACSGLDADSRAQMLGFIETLASQNVQLLIATHRRDEIVDSISHVAHLHLGRMVSQGKREEVLPPFQTKIEYSISGKSPSQQAFRTLVEIENADVFIDETPVLHELNWTWKSGEHWRIRGENGSGKSTFLKLIAGDLWPFLGGKIRRFDDTPFADIWQMKRRIGVVSPALQERFQDEVTAFEAVASGFFSFVGVTETLTSEQRNRVEEVLEACGIAHLKSKLITQMSSGEMRKTLLARALVNNPDILLLDEPFDSLDENSIFDFKKLLTNAVENGAHILLVSHHDEDSLPFLTHEITLQNGRVV